MLYSLSLLLVVFVFHVVFLYRIHVSNLELKKFVDETIKESNRIKILFDICMKELNEDNIKNLKGKDND